MTESDDSDAGLPGTPNGREPAGRAEPPTADDPLNRDMGLIYRRIAAWILDGLIVGVVTFLIGASTGSLGSDVATVDPSLLLWAAAFEVVYRWASQSAYGVTIGKLTAGVRVVSSTGGPAGPLRVLGREAVLFLMVVAPGLLPYGELQIVPLLAYLVSLWVVFRRADQRAIHDLPVGTRVVRAIPRDAAGGGGPLRPRLP